MSNQNSKMILQCFGFGLKKKINTIKISLKFTYDLFDTSLFANEDKPSGENAHQ